MGSGKNIACSGKCKWLSGHNSGSTWAHIRTWSGIVSLQAIYILYLSEKGKNVTYTNYKVGHSEYFCFYLGSHMLYKAEDEILVVGRNGA